MSVIAIDFGGTRCKAGLVRGGQSRELQILDTPRHGSLAQMLPDLHGMMERMAAADAGADPVRALAWALPCIISPDGKKVVGTFGKFEDAPRLDLAGWARNAMGLPLLLENDARAAALGEWTHGAGRGVDNMVMVTLGTGIGTGVVCEGRPLRGRNGMAGSLGGHTATHVGGATCSCGVEGCLEAQIATWALPGSARARPDFPTSPLAAEPVLDYEAIFRHAAAGDPLAIDLRDRALSGWSALLVNMIHSYDPERIVIGGGIMKGGGAILPVLREKVGRQATQPGGPVQIVPAALGDAAALHGAAWRFEASAANSQMPSKE
jgi:glucokinase